MSEIRTNVQRIPEGSGVVSPQPEQNTVRSLILNLTQHPATPEQLAQGVVDPSAERKARIQKLLTFDALPTHREVEERAQALAKEAEAWLGDLPPVEEGTEFAVMIGGAPFLMAPLERALAEVGFGVLYAFSARVSEEKVNPDGSVTKVQVFKHLGFVEVE